MGYTHRTLFNPCSQGIAYDFFRFIGLPNEVETREDTKSIKRQINWNGVLLIAMEPYYINNNNNNTTTTTSTTATITSLGAMAQIFFLSQWMQFTGRRKIVVFMYFFPAHREVVVTKHKRRFVS